MHEMVPPTIQHGWVRDSWGPSSWLLRDKESFLNNEVVVAYVSVNNPTSVLMEATVFK